jgi:RNA polymerase sigma-70 factor (ECF subfamily)
MVSIHQLTDAELIQSYQSGNGRAIELLVDRYKDKMFTGIFVLVKDKCLAEDIFQDAFLKIIRTIKSGAYAEQGKFLPWAMRVAHNLCMDHFRKVRHKVSVTLPDGRDLAELIPIMAPDASEGIERRQTHTSIRKLIEQLPGEQREVITLRIYGEQSFKEIATTTGVSINTALGRMRYALINLRRMITENQLVLR